MAALGPRSSSFQRFLGDALGGAYFSRSAYAANTHPCIGWGLEGGLLPGTHRKPPLVNTDPLHTFSCPTLVIWPLGTALPKVLRLHSAHLEGRPQAARGTTVHKTLARGVH